ncbi:MAG: hypothetical protein HYZ71_11930 [Deltaproteobacteria bacterium]|nr:hypothetical protein [Deltaproteobacteria bacterium]
MAKITLLGVVFMVLSPASFGHVTEMTSAAFLPRGTKIYLKKDENIKPGVGVFSLDLVKPIKSDYVSSYCLVSFLESEDDRLLSAQQPLTLLAHGKVDERLPFRSAGMVFLDSAFYKITFDKFEHLSDLSELSIECKNYFAGINVKYPKEWDDQMRVTLKQLRSGFRVVLPPTVSIESSAE